MKPIGKVTFWRDPNIAGIEICRVDGSRHVFPDHVHDDIYVIGLMDHGSSYCLGPNKTDSLVARGQIALINPGQIHSGVPHHGGRISYRMFYVSLERMVTAVAEISKQDWGSLIFPRMVMDAPRLRYRLHELYSTMGGLDGRLAKESAVTDALAHLITCCSNLTTVRSVKHCGRQVIRRAMDYLAADLDHKISLEATARTAGLSRYHFLRVFKQETGLSPHLFRTLRRIDRAKALLRGGTPLSETALSVGFSDQSHFSNTFRKYTGATPGQYLA
jgi:AraC-like DNA-binding protein